ARVRDLPGEGRDVGIAAQRLAAGCDARRAQVLHGRAVRGSDRPRRPVQLRVFRGAVVRHAHHRLRSKHVRPDDATRRGLAPMAAGGIGAGVRLRRLRGPRAGWLPDVGAAPMSGVLVFTVLFPAVAAAVIFLGSRRDDETYPKWLALTTTLIVLAMSLALVVRFDRSPAELSGQQFQS